MANLITEASPFDVDDDEVVLSVVVRSVEDATRPVASEPEEYELPTTLLLLLLLLDCSTATAAGATVTVVSFLLIKSGCRVERDSEDGGVGG